MVSFGLFQTRLDSLGVRCSLPPMLALHGVRSSTPTTAASGISAALARRPHVCSFCGRRFKRKDHKTEHERIHTGERPYSCSFCSAAFVQKQQLVGHQRRRHGIEPARGFGVGLSGGEMYHPDGDDLAAAVNAVTQHQHQLAAASSGHDLEQLYHHADSEDAAGLQSHHEELFETSVQAHQRESNRNSRPYHQHSSHQHQFLVHQDESVNGRGGPTFLPQASCLLPGSSNRGLVATSSGSSHDDLPLAHLTALAESPRTHRSNR